MKYWIFPDGSLLKQKYIQKIGLNKFHDIEKNVITQYPELEDKILAYSPRQRLNLETDLLLKYADGSTVTLTFQGDNNPPFDLE